VSGGLRSVERKGNGKGALERNYEARRGGLVETGEDLAKAEGVNLTLDLVIAEVEELVNKLETFVDDGADGSLY
jgi:hypothetical protein